MLPLLLTALGSLSTGLGSLASLLFKNIKRKHLSVVMGFAAGVMLYISFAELLEESMEMGGFISANLAFFTGIFLMMLLDYLIPHSYLAEHIIRRSEISLKSNNKVPELKNEKKVGGVHPD